MNTCFNDDTWVWCTRVQDNSAQCKIQKKTTRPTFSEGLMHVTFTWKICPCLSKNKTGVIRQSYAAR